MSSYLEGKPPRAHGHQGLRAQERNCTLFFVSCPRRWPTADCCSNAAQRQRFSSSQQPCHSSARLHLYSKSKAAAQRSLLQGRTADSLQISSHWIPVQYYAELWSVSNWPTQLKSSTNFSTAKTERRESPQKCFRSTAQLKWDLQPHCYERLLPLSGAGGMKLTFY